MLLLGDNRWTHSGRSSSSSAIIPQYRIPGLHGSQPLISRVDGPQVHLFAARFELGWELLSSFCAITSFSTVVLLSPPTPPPHPPPPSPSPSCFSSTSWGKSAHHNFSTAATTLTANAWSGLCWEHFPGLGTSSMRIRPLSWALNF